MVVGHAGHWSVERWLKWSWVTKYDPLSGLMRHKNKISVADRRLERYATAINVHLKNQNLVKLQIRHSDPT